MQVDIMPPARRMEHFAFKRLHSRYFREFGYNQHTDGGYKRRRASHMRLPGAHIACFNTPNIRIRIPLSLVERRVETTMWAQVVLVRYFMHILQNFWLRAMSVFPIWFEVRREGVEMDGNIGSTAL